MIRAFFRAAKVSSAKPPYDTIHLKVLYPAQMSSSERQGNFGVIPAESTQAPFPVLIFFNGFNCSPEMYHWLAVKLVERGLVVVTFACVSEYLTGIIGMTPGVDVAMGIPATYGTAPTALAMPTLLAELETIQAKGVLAGMLNLQQIILGGHSGGGRVALENADPRFYPQVAAAFSYGGHSAAPTMLGFEPGTILPLSGARPLLLMGGTCDGVIAASSDRYGMPLGDATSSIVRTFKEAFAGGRNDTYVALLEGANHFSIAYPLDTTTASSFLDLPATQPEDKIRSLLVETIGLFIDAFVRQKQEALPALNQLLSSANPLVAYFETK